MNKTVKGITIEIGGNTVNLGKALNKADEASKKLNYELASINRQLKFNPSSAVLLTQKQEVLKESITASKEKLKELEAVQQDIERAYKNKEIDDGQYRAYQREVEQTKNRLKEYEIQLNSTKTKQADFDKRIEKARQTIEANKTSLKAGIKTVGKYGTAVVGALGAAAGAAIKYAAEFETAFAKTSTLLDAKEIDLNNYKKEIIKASNETGVAASKIADSTYDAISAGVDPKDAVKFVKQAEKLSKGGFTEISKSVDILTTILNAYHMKVKDTTHVSDVLLQTQNRGKVLIGELSQYMGKLIPIAEGYSVSLENVASGYAILTARGIKAAQSTTYMKSLLDELAKEKYKTVKQKDGTTTQVATSLGAQLKELTGKNFAELMKSGKSLGDVLEILYKSVGKNNTAFSQLFSKSNARAAALALMKAGTSKFNSTLKEMKNSTGAADEAYKKMTDTASHKTEVLKTNIQNAAIEIGEGMLPTINDALTEIQKHLPEIQKIANDLGIRLGKDLKWIIKNGDQIIDDLKVILKIGGGIYAGMKLKQFCASLGETVAAFRILKTATDAETASQIALNTAQKANVIGLVVAGLATLAGIVWACAENTQEYTKAVSSVTNKERELYNRVKDEAQAWEEAKKARQENVKAIESEYSYYDELLDELDKIVDKNGKVKDGYEARAKFIANTLSDKLGTEIKLNGKIIENYKDIRAQIKKTIKAKREEAQLNAYKDSYEKAIKTASGGKKSSGYKAFTDALNSQKEKEKALEEAQKKLKYTNKYPGRDKGYISPEWKKANNQVNQAKKDLKDAEKAVKDSWNVYAQSRTLVKRYEEASAAVIEGNHNIAKKALNNLSEEIVTAGKATNKIAGQQLLKQYRSAEKKYEELATSYANGEKGITKAMVNESKRRRNRAQKELDIYANNVGIKSYEVAAYLGDRLTKTNTKENKEKAKSRAEKLKKPILDGFKMSNEDLAKAAHQGDRVIKSATSKTIKEKAKAKAEGLGQSFIAGFIAPMFGGIGIAFNAAWNFVKGALKGAKKAQDSNSPSKETTKLVNDFMSPYINLPNKKKKEAYSSAYDFVKSAVKGASAAQTALASLENIRTQTNLNTSFVSEINHKLYPVKTNAATKETPPKVSVSSPVITIQFGDVSIRDDQDIKALSTAISEQIAAELVLAGKQRGY